MEKRDYKDETRLVHDDDEYFKHHGAIVPPIYQNSLFAFENWDDIDKAFDNISDSYVYSRLMNPTVEIAEKKIAQLCHGEKAKLCASGMAAISSAILHYVKAGDHIVTIKNVYGPANNFIGKYLHDKCGIDVTYIRGTEITQFEEAIRPNTTLFYLESPASMTYEQQDLVGVIDLAREKNIKTIIDNTWASPVFQKPLLMGIDMEVHSVSKYIGGHSDVVAGVIVGKTEDVNSIIVNEHALLGGKMSPFEGWLVLRSLRTLPIRMKQHQNTALTVAAFLHGHPRIRKVYYPGLPSNDQYELGKKQLLGYGGLMSIEIDIDDIEGAKLFVDTLELFKLGVSWGGHESLVYSPSISYIKELSPEKFEAMGIKIGLVRLSIGLESAEDLISDLERALLKLSDH